MAAFPTTRLRRLRGHENLRRLIRETPLSVSDFVLPLFIHHGKNINNPIVSMPGQSQISIDNLTSEIKSITDLKIPAVLLFGLPEFKDDHGSSSWHPEGIIQRATKEIKKLNPDLLVIADLCFCEYTDHGHCGVMNEKSGRIDLDNDATLENLAKQAVSLVQAGVDVIAPSGMLDGMVHSIRAALDQAGFVHVPILSYSVKFSSSMYGPFREAADGAPQFGDRRSYQMDPPNGREALREARHDILEGADMLMVKPAHTYLDVIARVKDEFPDIPMGAYHVSGEYSMIKAAAEKGWLDEKAAALEVLTSIKRAGADFIITYFAKDATRWLSEV